MFLYRGKVLGTRAMSYDMRQLERMNARLQRKINILKMFTDHQKFNYEQPKMTYDRETGDVHIHDPKDDIKEKRIINSIDEVFEQKKALFAEAGLDADGLPKDQKPEDVDPSDIAKKLKLVAE